MDGRDRVKAAISLEMADRPPFGLWGHTYIEEWDSDELARITVERARRYKWDYVKFQPRASCFAESFGSTYKRSGHPLRRPSLRNAAVTEFADWDRLVSDAASNAPLSDQVASIGRVAGELGEGTPVVQTIFSPMTVAGHIAGEPSAALEHFRRDQSTAKRALSKISKALIDFSLRSIDAGASGIFFAVSGVASADMMSEDEYRALALRYDLEVLESLPDRAWFNVVHLCQPNLHFDLSREFPCQAISWAETDAGNPSLEKGLEISGRASMGGIERNKTLVKGPVEAIRDEVEAARTANGGKGIIVAPGCSVPPKTPLENLQAVTDAAS
ncbi:MAG: uroporphyrinogen decarboxylase family protein [Acidimicrobiia bacterium]